MDSTAPPKLSVIIPAFNEARRIVPTLEDVAAHLEARDYGWEVLVVDDGSADDTAAIVEGWAREAPNVRLIRIAHFGKGWAVKTGMLESKGAYRFMCDADLSMPIEWLDRFVEMMDEGEEVVIGVREGEGAARYDEPFHRYLMGRAFNLATRLILALPFRDTQCGFKCFSAKAAEDLFSLQRSVGMGFDVEILYLAAARGYGVAELPIDWYHKPLGSVRVGVDSLDSLKDTALVRIRSALGKYEG